MNYLFSTKSPGLGGQIKRRYTDFIVEEEQKNGNICEVISFLEGFGDGAPIEKIPEPKSGQNQLHMDLEKINTDVNFCIKKITRFIQCSKNRIGYAGLKDKRGVTCQRISIFEPNPELLKKYSAKGMELRNPKWENQRI